MQQKQLGMLQVVGRREVREEFEEIELKKAETGGTAVFQGREGGLVYKQIYNNVSAFEWDLRVIEGLLGCEM